MRYTTPSGLWVTDARSERGLPAVGADGRDNPPNATPPGPNVHVDPAPPFPSFSPISVGPNASQGYGNSHVMYPAGGPVPQPWSGWPVDWTPPGVQDSGLLGRWGALCDIVFACLDLNSSILSTMPPYIVKDAVPQPDEPWLVNPEPTVYPSWTAFIREVFWCLEAVGEVFLYATEVYAEDGRPRRFMMLNPAFVNVDGTVGDERYSVAGADIDRDDILHIKYASWPGDLHGHGPLEVAGARLLAAQAMLGYSTTLARSGGLPPAVLRHPKRLSRVQMQQMQSDWVAARMSGLGLPAVLSDGTELDVLNSQVKDAALSEMQRFNEARIAMLLGVPPFLVGLPTGDSSTYANTTNLFDFHWRAHLRPKAEMVMKALSGWVLPRHTAVEMNRDEYIRPGMFERSQSYAMLVGAGILSAAEVRAMERYTSAPGSALLSGAEVPKGAVASDPDPNSPGDDNGPFPDPIHEGQRPFDYGPNGVPLYAQGGRPVQTNTGSN